MSSVTGEPDPMLSVPKVAELFDVTSETVRDWIKAGKIKATKINGYWKVPKSEVIRLGNSKYS